MTPEQFKVARLALGLNNHELARFMGRTVRTIQIYQVPGSNVDPLAGLVMGWMVTGQCPCPKPRKPNNVQADRLDAEKSA